MPHFPKPFFRPSRQTWFVQIQGKQINLGADRTKAFRRYHELMRESPAKRRCVKVVELIDEFLDSVSQNQATDTYEWYRARLQRFADRYPDLEVAELRPFHVQRWIDSFESAKSGTKRNYARSIVRVLWWALEQGHIENNPLARFKKPKAGKRETVISPEEFQRILACVPNSAFRDLLTFAWETGARASECMALQKRHVDLRNRRIVFPQSEEKMEREPRVIYLNDTAVELVRRRMQSAAERVFTNTNGRPWTTDALNCAFTAVQCRLGKRQLLAATFELPEEEITELTKKLRARRVAKGKPEISEQELREDARRRLWDTYAKRRGPKYCLTVIRHSWCHRALKSGLDALTVSQLMGHADVRMVAQIYSHLSHAPDFLREAMQRATGTA